MMRVFFRRVGCFMGCLLAFAFMVAMFWGCTMDGGIF